MSELKAEGEGLLNLDHLSGLSKLIQQLKEIEVQISECQEALDEGKKHRDYLSGELIPELMTKMGIAKLLLETGEYLSVEKQYFAKIPKEQQALAFKWLQDNGLGAVIKTKISTSFGAGQGDKAKELNDRLQEEGYLPDSVEGVHPQTLKALVKEKYESGEEIPEDLFGIYVKNTTKIK
jgi:hypothetical protein|tara:strand:- start:208 stop:744 length:537 start_codon:yes stop_codon:yes gene_type:complete